MKKFCVRIVILGVALLVPSLTQAQTHVYNLNGTFNDLYGGPSLVGNSSALSSYGFTFGGNQGLSLSNVITGGSYSLVFRANYTNLSGNDGYAKLVDFKNRVDDNGYYVAPVFAADYWLYHDMAGPDNAYALGSWSTTVLTRDGSSGLFTAYVNGVQQLSFVDATGSTLFDGPNNIVNLFMDDAYSDQGESPNGTVDYIAVYEGDTFSPLKASSYLAVTSTPEPASITLLATGLIGIIGVARRRRKEANVA